MRRASRGETSALAVMVTAAGTMHSPARTGDSPATSWKYWVTRSIAAPVSIVLRVMPLIAAAKVRFVSSRRSSRGSARVPLPAQEGPAKGAAGHPAGDGGGPPAVPGHFRKGVRDRQDGGERE